MIQELRYAFRSLTRTPGFTAVAVLTLALGIGATTAIFSVFDAVMLKNLPVSDPQQLFIVNDVGQYPIYQALRKETGVFSDVLASGYVNNLGVSIDDGGGTKARVSLVSASYFSTLGVSAAIGRTFGAADEQPQDGPAIAVASYGYWQQRLARDAHVVGRRVRVSDVPVTIVGVAPEGFFGEEVGVSPDLWVPLTMWGQVVPGRNLLQSPGTSWLRIIGRLQQGVRASEAEARLTPVMRRQLEEIYGPRIPADIRDDISRFTVILTSAEKGASRLRARFEQPLELLMAAVVLVLIIGCANVANLLLARGASRRREIDLQLALGMSRARLVRQVLTESLVLSVCGATLGLAIAWAGREGLLSLISEDGTRLPVAAETDLRVLTFTVVTLIGTAILFGSVPAWRSVRASLVSSLASRHGAAGGRGQVLSPMLVVAQIAVSLVLLMGAGLFLRTLANLRDVDLGFVSERLVVLDVNPRAAGYSAEQAVGLTHRILERLEAVPGVTLASFSENGLMFGRDSSTNLIRPEGFVAGPDGFPRAQWDIVGPNYFSTMGITRVAGRDFTDRDDTSAARVVAINSAMAQRFFEGVNPIGRRLVWGDDKPVDFEIVAVLRDVKQSGPRDQPHLRFYLPYRQLAVTRPSWELSSVRFLLRTAADPVATLRTLQPAIRAVDPRLSVDEVRIGPELLERTLVQERMIATLSIVFGLVAAGLACVGLYGLIAYHVVQRTSEIGIRMALGAQPSQVLRATLRRALVWTAGGIAIGIPLALGVSRVADGLLFGLSAADTATLAGAAIAMLACGLVAAYLPARRAAGIDPLVALRRE